MCSAPYGRKKRPRSAGSIFPVSKGAQTEPERRESAEGAVDGSRMVSAENTDNKTVDGEVFVSVALHQGTRLLHSPDFYHAAAA